MIVCITTKLFKVTTIFVLILYITLILISCRDSSILIIHEDVIDRPTTELINLSYLNNYDQIHIFREESTEYVREKVINLPKIMSGYNPFNFDLRSANLSELDLSNKLQELNLSVFDNKTVWPSSIPNEFQPETILELGSSPGLGINELHTMGITGKGVNIAIIDSALYQNHIEYRGKIKTYEYIHCLDESSQMHSSLVTSILVGDKTGVAPEASVYYIASTPGDILQTGPKLNYNYYSDGIERILEINNNLSDKNKIRVISISIGLDEDEEGYDRIVDLIDYAKNQGVFVITVTPNINYDFRIGGLSRDPISNPNLHESYKLGSLMSQVLSRNNKVDMKNYILVPMDNRTTANCTGQNDYQYFNVGGNSVIVPWVAGLYALCLQVELELTPDDFVELAYISAYEVELTCESGDRIDTKIFNPKEMISSLMK